MLSLQHKNDNMSSMPLVSISIPVYKCEDFLKNCLDSVRKQTYPNLEVILVNDCTPDSSAIFAERYINEHHLENYWRIIHLEKNSGLSVVRNVGIDNAQGKYLFFLDSDDTIECDCIEKMVEIAERENVEMVAGEVMGIKLPNFQPFDIFPIAEKRNIIKDNREIIKSYLSGGFFEASWNKLISLDFLRKNKLYFTEGLFSQDSLQSFQVIMKLSSIAFLRKKTYNYYLHEKSVIHNRERRHFLNWVTILTHLEKEYQSAAPEIKKHILLYLINYQYDTLQMNWKAQKNRVLWEESYNSYKSISRLSLSQYFSPSIPLDVKKKSFYISLPTRLGFRLFKYRFERK